jgi:hypothetical protein
MTVSDLNEALLNSLTRQTAGGSSVKRNVTPHYFLGALRTDGASMKQSLRLAQGYAVALEEMEGRDDDALTEWMNAMAGMCLSRGWEESAIAMLATESDHLVDTYTKLAEKVLQRVKQKED